MNPPYVTVPGREIPTELTHLEVEVLQAIAANPEAAHWAHRMRHDALMSLTDRGLITHGASLIPWEYHLTDLGDAVLMTDPTPVPDPARGPDRPARLPVVELTAAQERAAYIESYGPERGDR